MIAYKKNTKESEFVDIINYFTLNERERFGSFTRKSFSGGH